MNRNHLSQGQYQFGHGQFPLVRFGRGGLSFLAFLGIGFAVGLWSLPALAEEGTPRTQSLDELLNSNSSSSWHSGGAISYDAEQIVSDARLAQQLNDDSQTAEVVGIAGTGGKKHHLHPVMIGLLAFGGVLVLTAAVLLIWSRIVQYREMRDAPSPMAFNYPQI